MRRMIILLNHELTDEQREDAAKRYNVKKFIKMSEDVKKIFSDVDPEWGREELREALKPIMRFILRESDKGDIILVSGEPGTTCEIVRFSKLVKLVAVHATSKRKVVEVLQENGQVVKKSVFKHVRFREF